MIECVGVVAYKLALLGYVKICPIFHLSQLKKAIGQQCKSQPLPLCLSIDMELQLYPAHVKDVKEMVDGSIQVHLHWQGILQFKSSWEDF